MLFFFLSLVSIWKKRRTGRRRLMNKENIKYNIILFIFSFTRKKKEKRKRGSGEV